MREEFDLDPKILYLNAGTHSFTPKSVLEAVIRYQRAYEHNPTRGLIGVWARLWELQKELAEFFRADPSDFFLRPNVTAVMNAFVLGAELPAGSQILATDLEYGAILNLCRFRAEQSGLSFARVELPSTPEESAVVTDESLAERVIQALKPETSLVVLSHVMSATGLILPIERIALETRGRGILLAVDGAHAPGSLALDFQKLGDVDFYGGSLHKWMMGPKGTSFGWVAKRSRERLQPIQAGCELPAPFGAFGEGDLFQARFLMSACHDFAPYLALHEMLEFWRRHGPGRIQARIGELQAAVQAEMSLKVGWPRISPCPGPSLGPLLAYRLPQCLAARGFAWMAELLDKEGLQISTAPLRGSFCLRISPHVYNTEEEIEGAAKILARA